MWHVQISNGDAILLPFLSTVLLVMLTALQLLLELFWAAWMVEAAREPEDDLAVEAIVVVVVDDEVGVVDVVMDWVVHSSLYLLVVVVGWFNRFVVDVDFVVIHFIG